MPEIELWKTIPGYESYEISSHGRVMSHSIKLPRIHPKDGSIYYRRYGKDGIKNQYIISDKGRYPHYAVSLSKDRKEKKFLVHRLVLLAFVGNCPAGMEACHNDGNGLNNKLSNLRWDTPSNNQKDRKKHGTESVPIMKGEDHPFAKLTVMDVLFIRSYNRYAGSLAYLAKKYNMSISTISSIVRRKIWKHI